jgi:hypothetical protein
VALPALDLLVIKIRAGPPLPHHQAKGFVIEILQVVMQGNRGLASVKAIWIRREAFFRKVKGNFPRTLYGYARDLDLLRLLAAEAELPASGSILPVQRARNGQAVDRERGRIGRAVQIQRGRGALRLARGR